MPSPLRFLPDLLAQLFALALILHIRRKWSISRPLRAALGVAPILIPAASLIILAQAGGWQPAYRWMWIPGLSFTYSIAFLGGLFLRAVVLAAGSLRRKFAPSTALPDPGRRRVIAAAADAAMAIPAVGLGYGIFIGRRQFRLVETELPLPGLHPDLEGLRMVQLSDIHLSPFLSRTDLAYCVDMANETHADLAFVTGDLITGIHDSIDDALQELSRIRAAAGVYGCNGNHEMYIEAEAYTAERAARHGMRYLRSEKTPLKFGDATINLAGVDHQGVRRAYLAGAETLKAPADLNLLLSHTPAVFPEAAAQGWDLTLSGHMHGGQINVELKNAGWNIARFSTPYIYGAYQLGRSSIYVTRGIGTVGIPVRLGAPPEVALIRLRPATSVPPRG